MVFLTVVVRRGRPVTERPAAPGVGRATAGAIGAPWCPASPLVATVATPPPLLPASLGSGLERLGLRLTLLGASEGAGEGLCDGASPGSLPGSDPAPLLGLGREETPLPLPGKEDGNPLALCQGSLDGFDHGSLQPLPVLTDRPDTGRGASGGGLGGELVARACASTRSANLVTRL